MIRKRIFTPDGSVTSSELHCACSPSIDIDELFPSTLIVFTDPNIDNIPWYRDMSEERNQPERHTIITYDPTRVQLFLASLSSTDKEELFSYLTPGSALLHDFSLYDDDDHKEQEESSDDDSPGKTRSGRRPYYRRAQRIEVPYRSISSSSHVGVQRKRYSEEILQILRDAIRHKPWSTSEINALELRTGLSKSQIYKWRYHQAKKLGYETKETGTWGDEEQMQSDGEAATAEAEDDEQKQKKSIPTVIRLQTGRAERKHQVLTQEQKRMLTQVYDANNEDIPDHERMVLVEKTGLPEDKIKKWVYDHRRLIRMREGTWND
ncbi:hypothetical protein PROFUN_11086 [Planoprotostelium fungivorum]|uniref:Homeobox domain-containing protein n=1 Tax=Planoprotostelium fungivorum TaxID=1890364 RepID=A0A2P6NAJ9_9EUKA|nr:hypothetical protein PROFUN_11086 [Planoprotostelium fungivorum]